MNRIVALLTLAGALNALASAPAHAQSDSTVRPRGRLCWRGRPTPKCSTFWITEFGYEGIVSRTQTTIVGDPGLGQTNSYTVPDFESGLVWSVGPMFNKGPTSAVGGTLTFSPTNGGARVSAEGRYRRWMPALSSVDLVAGVVRADMPHPGPIYNRAEYGVTAGAYLVGGGLIHVNGRADLLLTGGRTRVGTSVGVGLGSYAGVVGSALFGALFILAVAAFAEGT